MKRILGKTIFGAGSFGILFGGFKIRQSYFRWKAQQQKALQAGSQLLETALGPIEYQQEGNGPVILVLHGSPGGYDAGISFAHWLVPANFTVLAPSRPGYLRTPLASGNTPEQQADLYAAMLDSLNLDKVVVLGVSGGGPSALNFALKYPERCIGLVLISALSQSYSQAEVYNRLTWGKGLSKRLFDKIFSAGPIIFAFHRLSSLNDKADPLMVELLGSISLHELRKAGEENDMKEFAHLDPNSFKKIAVPVLILHGTADIDIPFVQAEQLSKIIPPAQFEAFEGGDHTFMTRPAHQKRAQAILQQFLETVGPAAETMVEPQKNAEA